MKKINFYKFNILNYEKLYCIFLYIFFICTILFGDTLSSLEILNKDSSNIYYDSLKNIIKKEKENTTSSNILSSKNSDTKSAITNYSCFVNTIYGNMRLGQHEIFHSNATGISEAAKIIPSLVYSPFSLTSRLNRFMFYGFPLLPNAIIKDNGLISQPFYFLNGADDIFCTQINSLKNSSCFRLYCNSMEDSLLLPHVNILWENGAFNENTLGIRFLRPITKKSDIGIFSNYRYSAPYNYTTANDMRTFYSYFFLDTSLIVNNGKNPLTNENTVTLQIKSEALNSKQALLSYTYTEAKNEIAFEHIDSFYGPSLKWKKISSFENTVNAQISAFKTGFLLFNAQAIGILNSNIVDYPLMGNNILQKQRGKRTTFFGTIEPFFLLFKEDTVFLNLSGTHLNHQYYNQNTTIINTGNILLKYSRSFIAKKINTNINLSLGDAFFVPSFEKINKNIIYNAEIIFNYNSKYFKLFGFRNQMPVVLPFEIYSENINSLFNLYDVFGAEGYFDYKKIGISSGITTVLNIDSTAKYLWPEGILPYNPPKLSFMITPFIGKIFGFSFANRFIFSDTKPYIKSQTILNYHLSLLDNKQHFNIEIIYDYWSQKDLINFGGISSWNREINNLSLKTSLNIQTFSLFYKIDNILNRKYAYIPGYFMPCITFRWGFGWFIQ